MTTAPFVSVRGLSVHYATRVVDDVSFDIVRGETLALVGESGSGKTTVARALLRLVKARTGEFVVEGNDVFGAQGEALRRMRRRIQLVFQDPHASLNPRMRVGDAIAEGMDIHRLAAGRDRDARVLALLDEVGLGADYAERFAHELSGGERQRVAIARALAVSPDFLVLDEAVSALDVTTQARLLDVFERIRAEHRLTSLFIAHNLAVVQRVASTVAVMYRGRILERAPAARIFAQPRHPYTRALIEAVPVPDPQIKRPRPIVIDDTAGDAVRGCPYYARCHHTAKDGACLAAVPALANVDDVHAVACVKESGV